MAALESHPDDGTEMPNERWAPEPGDDAQDSRLKLKVVRTFTKHASGRGLEAALNILLRIASNEEKVQGGPKKGKPVVDARTRARAASEYVRFYFQAQAVEEGKHAPGGAPVLPGEQAPGDEVVRVRVREVEAIIGNDEALRRSIHTLDELVRTPGGPGVAPVPGQMDPRKASPAHFLPPGAGGNGRGDRPQGSEPPPPGDAPEAREEPPH